MDIDVYRYPDSHSIIDQMPIHRDWMDQTFDRHAYQCFPVSMANRLGWGISFDEEISFIWDGVNSSEDGHIEILKGGDFVSTRRANRTVSFETGLQFSPENNISLLTMPPPNVFFEGFQCMSTIISTSALIGPLPIALMVTEANKEITIPKNTVIATVLPVLLSNFNNMELNIKSGIPDFMEDPKWLKNIEERSKVSQQMNSTGNWTHFYRDAVDHKGDPMGMHEVKKIVMKVNYED